MCKDCKCVKLEPIIVWYSIQSGGDGSAYPSWFLTEEASEYDQANMDEGWGEYCNGSVETYVGSDIHQDAMENDIKSGIKDITKLLKEEKNRWWFKSLVENFLSEYDPVHGFKNYKDYRHFLKMDE